jgi:hypothetical protein
MVRNGASVGPQPDAIFPLLAFHFPPAPVSSAPARDACFSLTAPLPCRFPRLRILRIFAFLRNACLGNILSPRASTVTAFRAAGVEVATVPVSDNSFVDSVRTSKVKDGRGGRGGGGNERAVGSGVRGVSLVKAGGLRECPGDMAPGGSWGERSEEGASRRIFRIARLPRLLARREENGVNCTL